MSGGEQRAAQVPLFEQLRRIPREAVLTWPTDAPQPWQMGSASAPVGRLAHEAADMIEATAAIDEDLLDAAKAIRQRLMAFVGAVAEVTDCGPDVDAITRFDSALDTHRATRGTGRDGPSPLLLAARAVMAVRPTNWDDADDPQAVAAWTALQDALKPADPDDLGCGICALGFVQGDPCLTDVDLGPVHAACCGPERESYIDLETGEPLKDGQPIPTPWIWSALFAAKPAALTPGVTILRHHDGRTGSFVEIEADGRLRVQSLKGKGFWIFAPDQCDRVDQPTDT